VYGERCSGTNYIENIISLNFKQTVTWKFGWKHFFGFDNLQNNEDTLFICIVRNPVDWINSLYEHRHHLAEECTNNIESFLTKTIYSVNDNLTEIINDRNIYTKERYKNIFELRNTKLKYMLETLPRLVKNHVIIRYEDLLTNFKKTMLKLVKKGLIIRENITFPINSKVDFKYNTQYKPTKRKTIPVSRIMENVDKVIERKLNYI
jgi:hypothetical protein